MRRSDQRLARPLWVLLPLCSTACTHADIDRLNLDKINFERIAYSALRQQDCLLNDPEGSFCDRSFATEFSEYEKLRRDFLIEGATDTTLAQVEG